MPVVCIGLWYITPPAPIEPETSFEKEGKHKKASLYVQLVSTDATQPGSKIADLLTEPI